MCEGILDYVLCISRTRKGGWFHLKLGRDIGEGEGRAIKEQRFV